MEYVEERDGGYRITGTRVSLDSVVYAFLRGDSPEEIAGSFPVLTLEQVFGALAFYLANREAVERSLAAEAMEFESMRLQTRVSRPQFYAKLARARGRVHSPEA